MTEAIEESFGPVSLSRRSGVALVTVDYPPVNSMGLAVLTSLGQVAEILRTDVETRVVILTGTGAKAFMAGADITEFEEIRNRENGLADHSGWAGSILAAWAALEQPVIAAVQASAVGGGLEIALTADIILAEPTAKFGLTEVKLGLIPAGGGTQRLPQRIGVAAARELMYLGGVISAARAQQLGLVNSVTEPGGVVEAAQAMASRIASNPRRAVQAVKRMTRDDLNDALVQEREAFLEVAESDDFREGFSAFLGKRAPEFTHH